MLGTDENMERTSKKVPFHREESRACNCLR